MSQITLFDAQTSNASSNTFYKQNDDPLNIYVSGNLDGGTLTLEAKTNKGEWVGQDISGTGFHVVDSSVFTGRVTLSGATSPDVDVFVESTYVQVRGG